MQFSKLTECMGKLVFEAIGKYIHPTRYRQIIETESNQILTAEERQWITEYQNRGGGRSPRLVRPLEKNLDQTIIGPTKMLKI